MIGGNWKAVSGKWKRPVMIGVSAFFLLLTTFQAQPAKADSPETYYDQIQRYGIVFAGICTGDDCACRDQGNCTLEDVLQVFVNISNFILSISGSLVLLFFVYGGFMFLTSQGSQEKIQTGMGSMKGAVIGLLIIFGAFAAINFLTGVLRGGTYSQTNYCELVAPPDGKAGLGWACLDLDNLDEDLYTCESGLCPGPATQVCCIATETE